MEYFLYTFAHLLRSETPTYRFAVGGRILMYNGNSYFATDKSPFIS